MLSSAPTHRTLPYDQNCPLPNVVTSGACIVVTYYQYRKMSMALLWLIPICAERRRVPFVGHLAFAAGICIDVHSTVAVSGLPDQLASVTEPFLLNFMIHFSVES
ncbi:hypothetical protein AVEN_119955-1 [Araneus ventricosus]|uniref:Uncharacterized protein n=1 Tax=Araneus ventricosus TaxID=182803 RepID=A0A4Y2ICM8_ARAVE|nr:hypothetical protein AVEN_119955-1 [Araneus ventricosus]